MSIAGFSWGLAADYATLVSDNSVYLGVGQVLSRALTQNRKLLGGTTIANIYANIYALADL